MHFSFSTKITLLKSGFKSHSSLLFCHEESFLLLEKKIIYHDFWEEIIFGRTWLLIIIWGFSSSSSWIILTASSLWMKGIHFWTTSLCELLLSLTQCYCLHFPLWPKAVILSGSPNGPLWGFGSCIPVTLIINQTCACSQGAVCLLSKSKRSTPDLGWSL